MTAAACSVLLAVTGEGCSGGSAYSDPISACTNTTHFYVIRYVRKHFIHFLDSSIKTTEFINKIT